MSETDTLHPPIQICRGRSAHSLCRDSLACGEWGHECHPRRGWKPHVNPQWRVQSGSQLILEPGQQFCQSGLSDLKTGCAETALTPILPYMTQDLRISRTQGCWEDVAWMSSYFSGSL
jgi:hypothetical protein